MDEERDEPIRASRLLAWATAGLVALGLLGAGVVVARTTAATTGSVSATGGQAAKAELPTTVTSTAPRTPPPTTVQAPTTTAAPKPITTAPPTTRAPRPTTTTSTRVKATTPTTVAAGAMVSVANNSPSAVYLKVNGREST